MARTRRYTDDQLIAALRETKGLVYLAAGVVGCHADTIHARIKKSPRVAEAVEDERGKLVDAAEEKLHDAVMEGEPWAIKFVLTTLGRDRGYGTQHQPDHASTVAVSPLNWAEFARIAEGVTTPKGDAPEPYEDPIEARINAVRAMAPSNNGGH